ncbi:hypothetical protein ES731_11580 [Psychroflexus gondwanensis]|jgi:hypothetical protein|uniref:Lipoprotein n=1 Tax=Psychroflexus gondwanensis ACAM 44 TaxID=1189619 RepID=N1WMS2_9FLAO|nr:hypothetical protein [Psychroflexus gondwanensis]EMY80295.1 hypothetical protein pgond44_12737 [Psychroflexus gondwanensis ACAM 44]TXE17700.1 hypothetical protein ES731_11580 [Psychroflexus gondwanensis]
MVKFYKAVIFLLLPILMLSCYEDDAPLVEDENTLHHSSDLSSKLQSITSHNASFDDVVDNAFCFSLVFPYELTVNDQLRVFNSAHDLSYLREEDTIEIVFPASIVFSDYTIQEVNSTSELNALANQCDDFQSITMFNCYSINFPLTLKDYNDVNSSFQTHHFFNNKAIFLYLENLHDSDVYEIDYPITLLTKNSREIVINNNQEFIDMLDSLPSHCE